MVLEGRGGVNPLSLLLPDRAPNFTQDFSPKLSVLRNEVIICQAVDHRSLLK